MKTSLLLCFVLANFFFFTISFAQTNTFPSSGAAGIGTTSPDASSLLEIKSTSKGILIPRLTRNQRDAIVSPAEGLMIYQKNSMPGFYYYDGTIWKAVTPKANAWLLTGNSGTNPSTNFIGTADAQPLMFRVNNSKAGVIDYNTGAVGLGYLSLNSNTGVSNTAIGYEAGFSNTTGYGNTAIGSSTLLANTTGLENTASGYFTLFSNSIGNYNVASGYDALASNTTANYNTAIGTLSLHAGNADNNTAVGASALYANTNGYSNVAVGISALHQNTSSHNTVAVGDSALYNQLTGTSQPNVAIGSKALFANTNADANTAIGSFALENNTTQGACCNVAIGSQALLFNTTGYENTASGMEALYSNTTGIANTVTGSAALLSNTTGNDNTANGFLTLYNNNVGSYNTGLGCFADINGNFSNGTAIGNSALITASDQVRIGNNSVTSIGGYVNWSNISDGRVKKNIKQNVPGLVFINKLQPITYNLDLDAANKIVQRAVLKDKDAHLNDEAGQGKIIQPSADDIAAKQAKEKIIYTGFIAQDVEKAAKSLNYDFSGVDAAKNDKDLYGLRYADFVVPLVKAVQELSGQNDSLKNANLVQQQINAGLEARIEKLETLLHVQQSTTNNLQTSDSYAVSLEQNVPNPFNQTTSIHYNLPVKFNAAQILITDYSGKPLKQINISAIGSGTANIDAGSLSAGTYDYSLIVDGKIIDTKKMVLTK